MLEMHALVYIVDCSDDIRDSSVDHDAKEALYIEPLWHHD